MHCVYMKKACSRTDANQDIYSLELVQCNTSLTCVAPLIVKLVITICGIGMNVIISLMHCGWTDRVATSIIILIPVRVSVYSTGGLCLTVPLDLLGLTNPGFRGFFFTHLCSNLHSFIIYKKKKRYC